jgi:hypothetical protein
MRVFYRALPGHPVRGPEVVYEQAGSPSFCCEGMRGHWGTMIGFGARNAPRSTDREVNVWTRIEQARGLFTWGLVAVNHCPFCGEAVEICRVKR